MYQIFSRLKAKLKEIYYETPLPNLIKRFKPKDQPKEESKLLEKLFPNIDLNDFNIPDDITDIKLEKYNKIYNLKLKNIPPHQWMQVGTSLLNMAYEDPDFGVYPDDDRFEEDPLPPPPEPTEYIKNLQGPLISLYLKDIRWPQLQEVGELFYDLGWHHRKEYDMDDYEGLPDEWHGGFTFPDSDVEEMDKEFFDPKQRLWEEVTEVKRITNSDVLPGIEKIPWKEDVETWLDSPEQDDKPWEDVPREDFISPGTIYPIQSDVHEKLYF